MKKGKELKPHIGLYGRRNMGKSSLINILAGQDIAIVSEQAGTTTDTVKKSFEMSGIGAVVFVDTAGIDDSGNLGEKRVQKTLNSILQIDLGILVISDNIFGKFEEGIIAEFKRVKVPFVIIHNKLDIHKLKEETISYIKSNYGLIDIISFSTYNPKNIEELVDTIKKNIPESSFKTKSFVGDLISYGDIVILITPIDAEAPAGRLILPQVQLIRDILDNDAVAIVLKEREVDAFLRKTGIKPKLVITDSQIFTKADAMIPRTISLTSFSIILARHKGDFENYLLGTPKISELQDGDRVLILESCSHHISCDDIGRVKIPRWMSAYTGKKLEYDIVSGLDSIPQDINNYALLIQCGGCMITRKQLYNRLQPAIEAGLAVTNYGMAIAYVQGIYERAVEPFVKLDKNSSEYL